MENFTTEVTFENSFNEGTDRKVRVKWSCEFEMRTWGIKDIILMVPFQTIETTIEDKEGNEFDKTYTVTQCKIRRDVESTCIHPTALILDRKPGDAEDWTLEF